MRRREFIGLVGGAASWPLSARSQQAMKALHIGTANVQPRTAPQWTAFVQGMVELGYKEGENFTYDHVQVQSAEAWEDGYRAIVSKRPDIVLARALKEA